MVFIQNYSHYKQVYKMEKVEELSLKDTFKWLWKFWGKLKFLLVILLIITPITIFFRSYMPIIISRIFDNLENNNINIVKDNIFLFGLFGFIHLILYILLQSLRGVINYKLEHNFRIKIFEHILNLSQKFYQKFTTGDLITRLVDDISERKLAWFACSGIFRFYEALIKIIQCFYFMISISPFLSFVSVIPLSLILILYIKFSMNITQYYKENQKSISNLNTFLTNSIDGIKIVKSYNLFDFQRSIFSKFVEEQKNKSVSLVKASSIIELSYSRMSEITIIIVFLFGGYLVINNKMTLGNLIAFNLYVFALIWPLVDIGQFFLKGRGAGVSVQRIKELEEFEPEIKNNTNSFKLENKIESISFENIEYRFDNGNIGLENINFDVKSGELIAIAGEIGSGKTTLLNLIPRVINPLKGIIKINGENIEDYDTYSLRNSIGYVPQNPSLFSETIKENIIFGREINEEEFIKSIKISQLEKEIENFTDKENTLTGQRGVMLSGGQKQRVAIARAIAKRPKILILDDCTSALDAQTEANLWKSLYDYVPGITVFLVTHRANTLSKANKVIFLEKGKITAIGTHKELLENFKSYREIYYNSDLDSL